MPTVPESPASWRILNDPLGALDNWPEFAAEFDRRWAALHGPDGSQQWPGGATFGDQIKAAHRLAKAVLVEHGVLPKRDDRG